LHTHALIEYPGQASLTPAAQVARSADADLSSISEKQKDDSSARAAAPASNPVFLGSIGSLSGTFPDRVWRCAASFLPLQPRTVRRHVARRFYNVPTTR